MLAGGRIEEGPDGVDDDMPAGPNDALHLVVVKVSQGFWVREDVLSRDQEAECGVAGGSTAVRYAGLRGHQGAHSAFDAVRCNDNVGCEPLAGGKLDAGCEILVDLDYSFAEPHFDIKLFYATE